MAVMASETDLRMFVQQGCFTIHSRSVVSIDSHPQAHNFLAKIEIPSDFVYDYAQQIDACGIRQGDIFPDLEHLAAELRHVAPPGSILGTKR